MISELQVEAASGRVARSQRVIDGANAGQIELRQMQIAVRDIRLARTAADVDARLDDIQRQKASQATKIAPAPCWPSRRCKTPGSGFRR